MVLQRNENLFYLYRISCTLWKVKWHWRSDSGKLFVSVFVRNATAIFSLSVVPRFVVTFMLLIHIYSIGTEGFFSAKIPGKYSIWKADIYVFCSVWNMEFEPSAADLLEHLRIVSCCRNFLYCRKYETSFG